MPCFGPFQSRHHGNLLFIVVSSASFASNRPISVVCPSPLLPKQCGRIGRGSLHVTDQTISRRASDVISRVYYDEKLKVIRFRVYKHSLDRMGDIESGCALVAHHKAIGMKIVSSSSRKATVCTSTGCLTCLLYLMSTWFDPCWQ